MPIREATIEDVPELHPLLRAYTDFYDSHPTDDGLAEMLEGVITAPSDQAFALVALDDDKRIIGFAICCWKWSSLRGARIVFLDDLFVDPAARGQGYADALIESVADAARRAGAPCVAWLTMPDNHRAHKVYDRVGGSSERLIEYELEL